jgi:hypothetical protein
MKSRSLCGERDFCLSEPDWRQSETRIANDCAVANQHAARFHSGATGRVENHQIT